jgi:carbon storage regulator CsrA
MRTAKDGGGQKRLFVSFQPAGEANILEGLREMLGLAEAPDVLNRQPASLVVAISSEAAERLERARNGLTRQGVMKALLLHGEDVPGVPAGKGLVLSRRLHERIVTNTGMVLTVVGIRHGSVRLHIQAPSEVRIFREEILGRGPSTDAADVRRSR